MSAPAIQSKRQSNETTNTDLSSEWGSGFRYTILSQRGGRAEGRYCRRDIPSVGKVLKFNGAFGPWFEIRKRRVGGCSDLVREKPHEATPRNSTNGGRQNCRNNYSRGKRRAMEGQQRAAPAYLRLCPKIKPLV